MRSEKRKGIILTVTILSIAMISATILYAGIVSFILLETKERSSDNLDEGNVENVLYNNEDLKSSSSPIYIYGNQGWEALKNAGECTGQGTPTDPYVLSYRDIDLGDEDFGIYVQGSDVYFRIEHCTITNEEQIPNFFAMGIELLQVSNGEIINNDISQLYNTGIYLYYSSGNTISGNNIHDNPGTAIYLWSNCDNNIISGNIINDNHWTGIYLYDSCDYNTISGNTVTNTLYGNGIKIEYECFHNNISGNTANNNAYYGIYGCGSIISGNTANYNRNGGIYGCADIVSANTANGNSWYGIYLYVGNSMVSGNTANGNGVYGIYIEGSHSTISGNTANYNRYIEWVTGYCYGWGVYLHESDGNIVSLNTANNNFYSGIWLEASNDNTVSANSVNYNRGWYYYGSYGYGIYLHESDGNNVLLNTANNNRYSGIWLDASNDNMVSENAANNNFDAGISLKSSSDNTIWKNLIRNNQNYGIDIISGQSNLIYQNSLIGTVRSHASDSGMNTQWDYLGIGNYWDNHTSPDSDNNGIVDNPYIWIVGSADSLDNYPLVESPHNAEKIHIDENAGNNWEWASTQPWCSGSGTSIDPYIIQALIINAGGSGSGILIENSNVYFRIANCEIYNAIFGIQLSNTNNGIISGNIVNKNSIGIYLHSSDDNTISGNTASNNQFHGIFLQDSNNNKIQDNTAHHNWIGIFLSYSNDNIISGNIIYMNWIAVVVQNSNNNIVSGNKAAYIYGNGIRLIGSNNNMISENTAAYISEYGIHLVNSSYNTGTGNILTNTGAGKYYEDSQCVGNNIDYS